MEKWHIHSVLHAFTLLRFTFPVACFTAQVSHYLPARSYNWSESWAWRLQKPRDYRGRYTWRLWLCPRCRQQDYRPGFL